MKDQSRRPVNEQNRKVRLLPFHLKKLRPKVFHLKASISSVSSTAYMTWVIRSARQNMR